jgi:hypothetical protein
MPPKKPKPASTTPARAALSATELLMESVYRNIDIAQEQIRRSHQIVAHSHQIVARVKLALARARRIQSSSGPGNPLIARDHTRQPGRYNRQKTLKRILM